MLLHSLVKYLWSSVFNHEKTTKITDICTVNACMTVCRGNFVCVCVCVCVYSECMYDCMQGELCVCVCVCVCVVFDM